MIKVYNKKVNWPQAGSPEDDMYFKYVLARYAPFCNAHWDFSKESNNEKDLDYKLGRFGLIRKFDPYRRLLTTHTDTRAYNQGEYSGVLDYRTDQNHRNFYDVALHQRSDECWPVVNAEYGYEQGAGGPSDKTFSQANDPLTILKRAWEVYMAGAYGTYYYTHTSWDVIHVDDTPVGYGYHKNLANFFSQVGFWLLEPNDSLVTNGGCHCMADAGCEYVVYEPEKKEFTLHVAGANGQLAATWFNPLTGEIARDEEVNNGNLNFTPPAAWAEGPVVLHVGSTEKLPPVFRSTLDRPLPTKPNAAFAFPGKNWETRTPAALGMDGGKLDKFADNVGGDGCIIRDGYLVKSWGEVDTHHDWWASASKPVLSTLLLLAVQEGRLPGVDASVKSVGWNLSPKDSTMTFRHLANMVSGYSRAEPPGAAWAYNDFAIKLYARSLEKVFHQSLDEAIRQRLDALQFEDGEIFGARDGLGIVASPRDFARIGWLWLNRGWWNGKEIISEKRFVDCIKPGVSPDLPRTATTAKTSDYLSVGSYGGGTDQTQYGPGVYGFNFWFNGRTSSGALVWPAAPADTYQANGLWNRDTVTVFPSLGMVVAVHAAKKPGKFAPGEAEGEYNQNMKLLVDATRGQ